MDPSMGTWVRRVHILGTPCRWVLILVITGHILASIQVQWDRWALVGHIKDPQVSKANHKDRTKHLLGLTKDPLAHIKGLLDRIRVRLGSTRVHLGSTKARLGSIRVRPDSTRVHLGSTRVHLDNTKVRLGPTRVSLDHIKVSQAHIKVHQDHIKARLDLTKVNLALTQVLQPHQAHTVPQVLTIKGPKILIKAHLDRTKLLQAPIKDPRDHIKVQVLTKVLLAL